MSMKNSNDTIGNRTCDLPACSAVPQPTAPLCAPMMIVLVKKHLHSKFCRIDIFNKSVGNIGIKL